MTNRIDLAAEQLREQLETMDAAKCLALEASLAIDFSEHAAYQDAQASAHAGGVLSTEEALTVYAALGEIGDADNGGWARGTDWALKVTVTRLMAELLTLRGVGR